MIPITCPSAGCYWTTMPSASVEDAAASFVTHYRAKHEPIQTPVDPGASPDLLPIDQGPVVPAKPKPSTKDLVTVLHRDWRKPVEPEMDDRGLTSGGTDPREFWSRPDPYPKAKRDATKAKKMGRPLKP